MLALRWLLALKRMSCCEFLNGCTPSRNEEIVLGECSTKVLAKAILSL
jgi:hypothetical protein